MERTQLEETPPANSFLPADCYSCSLVCGQKVPREPRRKATVLAAYLLCSRLTAGVGRGFYSRLEPARLLHCLRPGAHSGVGLCRRDVGGHPSTRIRSLHLSEQTLSQGDCDSGDWLIHERRSLFHCPWWGDPNQGSAKRPGTIEQ